MFSQHNESRNFFPRLLYFTLQHFGGWDVRKEIRVVFFGVWALCLLLRTSFGQPLRNSRFQFGRLDYDDVSLLCACAGAESLVRDRDRDFLSRLRAARGRGYQSYRARFSLEDADKSRSRFRRDLHFCERHVALGFGLATTRA